uniref:Uncharacterized protein n=1 Tax=Poecilia mexicana TaxID=48701 RepID=A0A3B3WB97_9TELE
MAEDHGLSDGNGSIDVTESLELLLSAVAEHKVLLDGVQSLLLSLQLDDVGFGHDLHVCLSLPLDSDALVLVSLRGDHDVGFVQHKHSDLLGIYKPELIAPVQHRTRCPNNYLFLQFTFDFGIIFAHLLDDFAGLKCRSDLGIFVVGVDVAEHCQDKGGRLSCP